MRLALVVILLAVAGCRSEPTFDERYEQAQERIEDKAAELDAQLQQPVPPEQTRQP